MDKIMQDQIDEAKVLNEFRMEKIEELLPTFERDSEIYPMMEEIFLILRARQQMSIYL